MAITKEYIKTYLLTKNNKLSSQRLRDLHVTESPAELFCIFYNTVGGKCETCGNPTKFKSFSAGYHRFCSKKCSASSRQTLSQRAKTNLEKYGTEHAWQSDQVKEKIKQTNRERLGTEFPMQSEVCKGKREITCLSRYGVKSVLQSTAIRDKGTATNTGRYGVEHPMQSTPIQLKSKKNRLENWLPLKLEQIKPVVTPAFNLSDYTNIDARYLWKCAHCGSAFESTLSDGKIPRCFTCHPRRTRTSQMETDIDQFIQSLGFVTSTSDKTLIAPQELDIVVHSQKLAFEINGNYWHSELNGRDKLYHLSKTKKCEEIGYRLIHIQSSEWDASPELVKSRIQSVLNKNTRIYARNCSVRVISASDANRFLDINHIQGSCQGSARYGLFYNGECVAVITFGKSRFSKDYHWELLRYASKCYVNVIGGAGKLLARFKKDHNPQSIISYSDLRWNTGKLYQSLGFEFSHTSPPNYYYTKDYITLESRVMYQKHKLKNKLPLFDNALTEWENMQLNGYDRIWDCGNMVFTWKSA